MLFTTSWDDGYALDLRIAKLLEEHGLFGTFYVCPLSQHERNMLTPEALRSLAERQEIGAHTLLHSDLTKSQPEVMTREIHGSKEWVETQIGKPCVMFCYPKGAQNATVREAVRNAGFRGARTTEDLQFSATDPYALPVTLQITPFPWRRKYSPAWKFLDPLGPLRVRLKRLRTLHIPLVAYGSWTRLAMYLLDHALENHAPFFHLYGHAHEIDAFNMWDDLALFLRYARERRVQGAVNSELLTGIFSS